MSIYHTTLDASSSHAKATLMSEAFSSTKSSKKSLRKAINQNCKNCIYDSSTPGTWLQQVSLCALVECPFFLVRPLTRHAIPTCVLKYYGIPRIDWSFYQQGLEGAEIQAKELSGSTKATLLARSGCSARDSEMML